MTKLNPCECGGEVTIRYDEKGSLGTHWYAKCSECGAIYPLFADNRQEAEKEWNEEVSETGDWS